MNISTLFIGPFSIADIIHQAEECRKDKWVYTKQNAYYIANYDARDYTDPEYDKLCDDIKGDGYKSFLTLTMIEDCVLNLKSQNTMPSMELKIKSVMFYYDNDAFIVV